MVTERAMVSQGTLIPAMPSSKTARGAYNTTIVSELIALITRVCPILPLAR